MAHPEGLEPPTFWSVARKATDAKAGDANALEEPPANACTTACTGNPETMHGGRLETLAAALRELTPEERAALARMLLEGSGE